MLSGMTIFRQAILSNTNLNGPLILYKLPDFLSCREYNRLTFPSNFPFTNQSNYEWAPSDSKFALVGSFKKVLSYHINSSILCDKTFLHKTEIYVQNFRPRFPIPTCWQFIVVEKCRAFESVSFNHFISYMFFYKTLSPPIWRRLESEWDIHSIAR